MQARRRVASTAAGGCPRCTSRCTRRSTGSTGACRSTAPTRNWRDSTATPGDARSPVRGLLACRARPGRRSRGHRRRVRHHGGAAGDAWGFGPVAPRRRGARSVELAARRAAVVTRVPALRLTAPARGASVAGLQADLGGIAKGYAVDLAARGARCAGRRSTTWSRPAARCSRAASTAKASRGASAIERPDAAPQRAAPRRAADGPGDGDLGRLPQLLRARGRRYSHEIDPAHAAAGRPRPLPR